MTPIKKIKLNRSFTVILIISAVSILSYSNSFNTSFQLDDFHTIQRNPTISDLTQFTNIESWQGIIYNRQIPRITYSLNYLIGGYDVLGYHIFNLIIHIINALLVYLLIRILVRSQVISKMADEKRSFYIPLFTALIFAAHPVQVQAVTYITQRMVSLAVMFYLISVIFYIKGRLANNKKSVSYFVITMISFLCGIYSKEIIYSIPLTIFFTELFFIRDENGKINRKYLYTLLAIIIIAAGLFYLRFGIPRQPDAPDHFTYLITQFHVLTIYMRLLIIPVGQHLYYLIPPAESVLNIEVLSGIVINGALLISSMLLFKNHRLMSFGIAWFYITLSVESSFFPLKFLIFEYRLYPAVIGFALVLVPGFYTLIKRIDQKYITAALSLIIAVLSFLTYQHNKVWKDPVTLWTNNVLQSPMNKEAHKNLGIELMIRNFMKEAYISFSEGIKLDSNFAEAYAHRSVILNQHPNFESAMKDADRAISLDSTKALYFNNRGFVYQSIGIYSSAAEDFQKAVELDPKYDNAFKNLSVTYYFLGNYQAAMEFADRAIKLDSSKADYFNNRGNIYFALGELLKAEQDFKHSRNLDKNYVKSINNLGVIKLKQNSYEEAIRFFNEAININQRFLDSYYYRAYCFILINKRELAYNDLIECLRIQPGHQGAENLLKSYFK